MPRWAASKIVPPGVSYTPRDFNPDEAIFQKVEPANAMLVTKAVELGEERRRGHRLAIDGDRIALFKPNGDYFRFVGRIFRRDCAHVHEFRRFLARVLKDFAFRRGVQQIRIDTEWRLAALVFSQSRCRGIRQRRANPYAI